MKRVIIHKLTKGECEKINATIRVENECTLCGNTIFCKRNDRSIHGILGYALTIPEYDGILKMAMLCEKCWGVMQKTVLKLKKSKSKR